jgi:putative transport protein
MDQGLIVGEDRTATLVGVWVREKTQVICAQKCRHEESRVMEVLRNLLQKYPEIAVFLTLALGFLIGKRKFGKFSLGVVTSTLLAGVLIGQFDVKISPNVKSIFFLMFLFAVGYGVGPQFFQGLKSGGLKQVLFAVVLCLACLFSAFLMAKLLGYNAGMAAGLLSGACTISAVLGVATEAINGLSIPPDQKKAMLDAMPVAYAVTYLFGTAGSAWFLAKVGPKLLRVNLAEESKKLEQELGGGTAMEAGITSAYFPVVARAYRLTNPEFAHKTVSDFESAFASQRIFVERVRENGNVVDAEPGTMLELNSVVAVAGRREAILENETRFGPEVDDREVLSFQAEVVDVVITRKQFEGKTLKEISDMELGQIGRGVFMRKLVRIGQEMPFYPGFKIQRGDVLTIGGAKKDVEHAAEFLGYVDRPTEATDMVIMGLGIAVGAAIGAITIPAGSIPLSLSTSGGALIAGLICGWLRSVNRTFGRIPAPALWVFHNVGLNAFIAVVGLGAGPGFISGLKANGLTLLLAGVVVTTLPFVIGLFVGKYIFKMNPAVLIGACAGARTTTAALGAIEEEAKSKVPATGYTVTYAVGNLLLTTWGLVIVLMMS